MNKKDKILKECLGLILQKKFSDANALIINSENNSGVTFGNATIMAIEGIVYSQSSKSENNLLEGENKLKKIRSICKNKLSATWADDFDKEYFGTWLKFINILDRVQIKSE